MNWSSDIGAKLTPGRSLAFAVLHFSSGPLRSPRGNAPLNYSALSGRSRG